MKLDESGRGAFFVEVKMNRVAEMVVAVQGEVITVFHTEVHDELRGTGVASQMLFALVNFAQETHKKVIPLCTYVRGQFEKKPDQYADIWKRDWHK